jgi:DNA invertase Pin-like site-specific DNA recombinase
MQQPNHPEQAQDPAPLPAFQADLGQSLRARGAPGRCRWSSGRTPSLRTATERKVYGWLLYTQAGGPMTRKQQTTRPATGRVIGYVRVSTSAQELSPERQRELLAQESSRRGWTLEVVEDNGRSGTTMAKRPGLAYALDLLARGQADALVVTKLDRLARSVVDLGRMMELAKAQGWSIVILDMGIDTTTANGELVANVVAAIGQWEARMIAERTREAMAVKRSRGERVGRPRTLPAEVRDRIGRRRADGLSLRAIAAELNADQVPTAQGGRSWHASTVKAVLES